MFGVICYTAIADYKVPLTTGDKANLIKCWWQNLGGGHIGKWVFFQLCCMYENFHNLLLGEVQTAQ